MEGAGAGFAQRQVEYVRKEHVVSTDKLTTVFCGTPPPAAPPPHPSLFTPTSLAPSLP